MGRDIAILGGGITGLALAWFLKQKNRDDTITVIEKSHRPGGWIKTLRKEEFLFELGPRSCRPQGNGQETLRLIESIGLSDRLIYADAAAHTRFLYIDKRLRPVPTNLFSLLFSPLAKGLMKALWRDLTAEKGSGEDESIYAFMTRRFGVEITERFIDPMVSGIHAGDIHSLSLPATFPKFFEWEQQNGGFLRTLLKKSRQKKPRVKGALFSLRGGMEELPQTLARMLGDAVRYGSGASTIRRENNRALITLENGEEVKADEIFCTLPLKTLAEMLSVELPSTPCASIAAVCIGYHKKVLDKKGFGYLIPTKENEEILGMVWDSSIFPEHNNNPNETRLTAMIGGIRMTDFDERSDGEFQEIALRTLHRHLGIDTSPDFIHVSRAAHAIPQYIVGHSKRMERSKALLKEKGYPITLLGSHYTGVAINDCIAAAAQAAKDSMRSDK